MRWVNKPRRKLNPYAKCEQTIPMNVSENNAKLVEKLKTATITMAGIPTKAAACASKVPPASLPALNVGQVFNLSFPSFGLLDHRLKTCPTLPGQRLSRRD
jgi:hypothetical protein